MRYLWYNINNYYYYNNKYYNIKIIILNIRRAFGVLLRLHPHRHAAVMPVADSISAVWGHLLCGDGLGRQRGSNNSTIILIMLFN